MVTESHTHLHKFVRARHVFDGFNRADPDIHLLQDLHRDS